MSEPHCVFCSDEEQAGPCFGPGRCMAEPARLSHDRGADAETLTRALDELQDAIDASQWVTAGNRLAALRAALLSVPAPTLPAPDPDLIDTLTERANPDAPVVVRQPTPMGEYAAERWAMERAAAPTLPALERELFDAANALYQRLSRSVNGAEMKNDIERLGAAVEALRDAV